MGTHQIPLSFPLKESYSRDNFMRADCNADALNWIDRWPDWPAPALIIHGPNGCGKTHLLHLWAERAGDKHRIIDDAMLLFGNDEAEKNLFHAYNLAKENGTFIILAMDMPPTQQNIRLPDLASRLRAAPQVAVNEPDDMAMQAVLVKLTHDRQMKITPEVINYILPRIERSFVAMQNLVKQLDTASLSEKRAITIPLVKTIIAEPELL